MCITLSQRGFLKFNSIVLGFLFDRLTTLKVRRRLELRNLFNFETSLGFTFYIRIFPTSFMMEVHITHHLPYPHAHVK